MVERKKIQNSSISPYKTYFQAKTKNVSMPDGTYFRFLLYSIKPHVIFFHHKVLRGRNKGLKSLFLPLLCQSFKVMTHDSSP